MVQTYGVSVAADYLFNELDLAPLVFNCGRANLSMVWTFKVLDLSTQSGTDTPRRSPHKKLHTELLYYLILQRNNLDINGHHNQNGEPFQRGEPSRKSEFECCEGPI
jgi:hypothetical protein